MNLHELMKELESLGSEQTRKTFIRHGAKEPFFGIKIGDLKKFVKHVKKDQELALALYETGNHDAMYLAGLAVDPRKLSKEMLQKWVEDAYWYMLSEYTVAGVAAESPFALELAREWISSDYEMIATAGWSTYANYVTITEDDKLDLDDIRSYLDHIRHHIHDSPNRVRYDMNQFVIAVGSYVDVLHDEAKSVAEAIGKVHVDVGQTACKVPLATDYIEKVIQRRKPGTKKKTSRC